MGEHSESWAHKLCVHVGFPGLWEPDPTVGAHSQLTRLGMGELWSGHSHLRVLRGGKWPSKGPPCLGKVEELWVSPRTWGGQTTALVSPNPAG